MRYPIDGAISFPDLLRLPLLQITGLRPLSLFDLLFVEDHLQFLKYFLALQDCTYAPWHPLHPLHQWPYQARICLKYTVQTNRRKLQLHYRYNSPYDALHTFLSTHGESLWILRLKADL